MIGIAAVAVLGLMPAARADQLNIRLRENGRALLIHNPNAFALGDCSVMLNSKYKLHAVSVASGGTTEVWYSELMSNNDVRYDPQLERLRRVFISCRKPTVTDISLEPSG